MNRLTELGKLSVSRKWKEFQEIFCGEFEQQQRRVFHKVMKLQSNLKRRSHRSEILKDAASVYNHSRSAAEAWRALEKFIAKWSEQPLFALTEYANEFYFR